MTKPTSSPSGAKPRRCATSPTSVRAGGTGALTEADRRADQARYQEVRCKSALNRAYGMPFSWTLNPYRGCTHGCHYCYARKYHKQFEMNADDEFASVILVKTNIVEVLRRELRRPSWTGELVAIGSATDCYQPIEGHYKLTRGALEVLLEHRNPASIVTKGPMIVRDKDLLARLSALEGSTRLRQRAVRRRRGVRGTGARHGLSAAAPARGARAGRRRRAGPDPDEPDRARVLVEAVADRAHGRGLRGARRAHRRRQRDAPRRGRPHALLRLARARAPGASAEVTGSCMPASRRRRRIRKRSRGS